MSFEKGKGAGRAFYVRTMPRDTIPFPSVRSLLANRKKTNDRNYFDERCRFRGTYRPGKAGVQATKPRIITQGVVDGYGR